MTITTENSTYIEEEALDTFLREMKDSNLPKPYALYVSWEQARHISENLLNRPFDGEDFEFDDIKTHIFTSAYT